MCRHVACGNDMRSPNCVSADSLMIMQGTGAAEYHPTRACVLTFVLAALKTTGDCQTNEASDEAVRRSQSVKHIAKGYLVIS